MWGENVPKDAEAHQLITQHDNLQRQEWVDSEKKYNEAAEKYLKTTVLPQMKGKKVFGFSYSDNSGEAVLEHGDIFSNLPHVQISHH